MASRRTRWLVRTALFAGVLVWAAGFAGVARAGLPSVTTTPAGPAPDPTAATANVAATVEQTVSSAPAAAPVSDIR